MSQLSSVTNFKQPSTAFWPMQWTDQGGLTALNKESSSAIEHGGLGFLPVKDLAAIARLAALTALPDNEH